MTKPSQTACFCFLLLTLCVGPARSATNGDDEAYRRALLSLQLMGQYAEMVKDWCDEQNPQSQAAHAKALQAWRLSNVQDEIDARQKILGAAAVPRNREQRSRLAAQLKQDDLDAAKLCGGLAQYLRNNFDPAKQFPDEYKLVLSRSSAPLQNQPTAKAEDLPRAATADNERSGNRQIKAVLLAEKWRLGYGGMMVLEYDPIVLFTDGSFTQDDARAVSASARIDGRWRLETGVPVLSDRAGKPVGSAWRLSMKRAGRPAAPNQRLTGVYGSFSGLGGGATGTTSVVTWRNYGFSADGSVTTQRGSGASTVGNTDGSESDVVTRSTASDRARYRLDGYTITFTAEDGSSRRSLFYFVGSKDDMIAIDGRSLKRNGE
jgi:hypothetical protein